MSTLVCDTYLDPRDAIVSNLHSFRTKVGVGTGAKINLVHVVAPSVFEAYRKRNKQDYLAKEEKTDRPLFDRPRNKSQQPKVLLSASEVKKMWKNTNIFVASPAGTWPKALKEWLEKT